MKLLFVFHSLYSLAGGVDNRVSRLETSLPNTIHREYLLFKNQVNLPHKGEIFIAPYFKIPKYILHNKKSLKLLAYIYGFITFIRRVIFTRKFIKNNHYNTLLAVDDYFALITLCASIGLNKKVVCSVRNNWDQIYNKRMVHLLPDFMYKKVLTILMNKYASVIHCVSKGIEKNLREKYLVKNCLTIYNSFDINFIRAQGNKPIDLNCDFIINIGHFNAQKNQRDLLLAYALLRSKGVKEYLVLVGDGNEKERLKALAIELKIDSFVIFVGQQQNPYKYLSKAKLYISSSLYEGLPAVLVEALILNIPVVSYAFNYGAEELTSCTAEMRPENLASKSIEVLKNDTMKQVLIKEGEDKIKSYFNEEKIMRSWIKVLS